MDPVVNFSSPQAGARAIQRLTEDNISSAFKTNTLFFCLHLLSPASRQSEFAVASQPVLLLQPPSANAAAILLQATTGERYTYT
jgi:hypothetical protein